MRRPRIALTLILGLLGAHGERAARAETSGSTAPSAGRFAMSHLGFATTFRANGALLVASGTTGGAQVGLHVARVGRPGTMLAVLSSDPIARGERVEIARGSGITEWFTRAPRGLEQGIDLGDRPTGTGELVVEVATDGLTPVLANGEIELRDTNGSARFRYVELTAKDADGRALPATLHVEHGAIALHVDDRTARYPLVIDPLVLAKQTQKLVSSDGMRASRFGDSLALSGTTAVIGSSVHDVAGVFDQGAAYVFVKTGSAWSEQAKLTAADGAAQNSFGWSVAVDGDTTVISTRQSAYVFVRSGTTWTQQAKLVPADVVAGDSFGTSVAVSGDRILVAASQKGVGTNVRQGVVYVFLRTGTTWAEETKLVATDGASGDSLGNDTQGVALAGSIAIAGASAKSSYRGAAYVWVRTGTTWTQQAKLIAADGKSQEFFGTAVGLSGTTAIVGAHSQSSVNLSQGAAYVFTQSGTTWSQQAKLVASDGRAQDLAGTSVAISGSTAFMGRKSGAAYVFESNAGAWTQKAKLTSGSLIDDEFGGVVAIDGTTALVSANRDTVGANEFQGTVYVYGQAHENGDACASESECVSGFCVHSVCCETACASQCSSGKCVDVATCNGNILDKTDGTKQNCAPYRCAGSDCLTECGTSDDCVSGAVCDSTKKLCVAAAPPAAEESGGCTTSTRTSDPTGVAPLLALLVALGAYRSRRL